MSDQNETQTEDQLDEVQYDPSSGEYDVYECVDCDNVVLVVGSDDPPMACHDQPMEQVSDIEMRMSNCWGEYRDPSTSNHGDRDEQRLRGDRMVTYVTNDPRIMFGLESDEQPDSQHA